MHIRLGGPLPTRLTPEVERDSKQTPQHNQTHVQHYRSDITILDDPGSDELAKSVTPHILVDSDGDEDRARHRLITINSISACNSG